MGTSEYFFFWRNKRRQDTLIEAIIDGDAEQLVMVEKILLVEQRHIHSKHKPVGYARHRRK